MPKLTIKPVETRREKKLFLELPWQINRGDPNWICPLRQNQAERVGYIPHPFYDEAEGQTFLALHDDRPVGRVMAILNHAHNRHQNDNRGFFGFFESIDDQEVAAGLFEAVRAWHGQRGITQVRGLMNASMNYAGGILFVGFGNPHLYL